MPEHLAVLLVEDSADDAVLIERHLKRGGFEPSISRIVSRAELVSALERQEWDVIICDHNLPSFSAPKALDVVKQMGLDVPFIIVSGSIDVDVAVAAMRAGAHDFLEKDNLARLNPVIEREVAEAGERRRRREAEDALRDRENRMRMILDQTPVVVWSVDKDLKYTSFSGQASVKSLGFNENDVIGEPITGTAFANRVGEGDAREIRSYVQQAMKGASADYSFTFGDLIWHSHIEPFRDENDQIIGVIGVSYDITEETRQESALRDSERLLRYLSHQLLDAHEKERRRLAREIHDGIGQSLAAIKIRTQNVMHRIEHNTPRTPETSLEAIVPIIQQTIDEVRRMQTDLHPAILDDIGIRPALQSLTRGFRETFPNIDIVTRLTAKEEDIPTALRGTIFRIAQEAISNATKHGGGDTVRLSLRLTDCNLVLNIADNGSGFNVLKTRDKAVSSGKLGLISMRERVESSGGRFKINSKPGNGTQIEAIWLID